MMPAVPPDPTSPSPEPVPRPKKKPKKPPKNQPPAESQPAVVVKSGNTLTLSFDDDPNVDSDHDRIPWNDQDHFERFQFIDADNLLSGQAINTLTYQPNTSNATVRVLVPTYTLKLSNLPVFTLTNYDSTVLIHFGLVGSSSPPFTKAVEIRTQAALRNRLQ